MSAMNDFLSCREEGNPRETVLLNGEVLIYTEQGVECVEALAFKYGHITHIGDARTVRARMDKDAAVCDLEGRTVMPGIHDAHMHGKHRGSVGVVETCCDMAYEGGTIDYVLGKLKAALVGDDQKKYLHTDYRFTATNFFGPATLPYGRFLTRHDLDRLSMSPEEDEFGTGTTRPIVVRDKGGHTDFVNSRALELAGVDDQLQTEQGHIGRDDDGRLNGVFNDVPVTWGALPPAKSDMSFRERLVDLEEANRKGITSIFQAAGTLECPQEWRRLADSGGLTVRVNQSINVTSQVRNVSDGDALQQVVTDLEAVRKRYHGYHSQHSPGTLAVDTAKVFADGESEYPHQTAAMLRPYNENAGTVDAPVWKPTSNYGDDPSCSDARPGFALLDRCGWNIHVHCLGNRSARESLDNFEYVQKHNPSWDRRHTIAHTAFVADQDVPRFARLGVLANMSFQWARRDAWSVDAQEGYINEDVLENAFPARTLLDNGAVITGGSDWPVDALNPWLQIETAVTREGRADPKSGIYPGSYRPHQAVSVEEALKIHTQGGAYQMHQEHLTGSIEVGKYADLIIIDRNPLRVPANEISQIRVLATFVGGVLVWHDGL